MLGDAARALVARLIFKTCVRRVRAPLPKGTSSTTE